MKSTNSEPPLVSVIMPTYNHAKFIGKAIESVLNQTYKNFELIIIDNYSEDDTEKIVVSYEDDRIIYLKFRNNGIIAASRNHGIKHSHGDYIAFLDSDDWWYREKLEVSVEVLKKGVQFVCHALDWYQNGTIIRTKKYGSREKATYRHLLFGKNCVATSATTVLRDSILRVGGFTEDPKAVGVEDYHLWLKLAKTGCTPEFIDQVLGCYRIYGRSQSSALVKQLNSEWWVLEDHFKALGRMSFLDRLLRWRRLGRLYASITVRWFLRKVS